MNPNNPCFENEFSETLIHLMCLKPSPLDLPHDFVSGNLENYKLRHEKQKEEERISEQNPQPVDSFKIGDRVIIYQLKKQMKFIGQSGKIITPEKDGRIGVKITSNHFGKELK